MLPTLFKLTPFSNLHVSLSLSRRNVAVSRWRRLTCNDLRLTHLGAETREVKSAIANVGPARSRGPVRRSMITIGARSIRSILAIAGRNLLSSSNRSSRSERRRSSRRRDSDSDVRLSVRQSEQAALFRHAERAEWILLTFELDLRSLATPHRPTPTRLTGTQSRRFAGRRLDVAVANARQNAHGNSLVYSAAQGTCSRPPHRLLATRVPQAVQTCEEQRE